MMVWIWLANTIGLLFISVIWNKDDLLNICIKTGWFVLTGVNGVMLYRALDSLGFFTAVGA